MRCLCAGHFPSFEQQVKRLWVERELNGSWEEYEILVEWANEQLLWVWIERRRNRWIGGRVTGGDSNGPVQGRVQGRGRPGS